MIRNPKRSINDVLCDPQHSLGKIIQKAKSIENLQKQLQKELPNPIAQHVWVGTYENGILTLLVDSAAIATQLRFSVPDIRENLRQQPQWYGLKSISVKIIVDPPKSSVEKPLKSDHEIKKTMDISKQSANLLVELANSIDDCHGGDVLKKALIRIAKYSNQQP